MERILCIAECCCDMIFAGLPRIPGLGEEVYGDSFAMKPGGGANTPMNLGRMGVPTTFLTRIGDDDMGRMILGALSDAGVEVKGQLLRPGSRTAVSAVLSTREDRSFASFGGCGDTPFDPGDLEAEIRRADVVHTYLGYCFQYPIPELCEKYGKRLSLDTSWCDTENPQRAREILCRCDYLKVNEVEAMRLTRCGDAEQALSALAALVKKAVVVTLGSKGSMGMPGREETGGEILRIPCVSCGEFRDACGAGDCYSAGMLFGISAGKNLENSMISGAHLAGQSVTWYGGNDGTLNCTKIMDAFRS